MANAGRAAGRLAQSFVFGTPNAPTMGYWGTMRYVSKAESETHEEFLENYKPSGMHKEIGDGLVVHHGNGEWEAPTMPQHLLAMYNKTLRRQHLTPTGKCMNLDFKGCHFMDEFAGEKMYLSYMNDAAKKYGIPHGLIRWSCPKPRSEEEESMVDTDWQTLAEGFLAGRVGPKVSAVIIRGPFHERFLKPQILQPMRSNREDYKFYIITDDFQDQDAVSEVNFRLRELDLRSLGGRWTTFNPLYQNYCKWARTPLLHLPPTGGDVLTKKQLRGIATDLPNGAVNKDPRASSLGQYGSGHKYTNYPIP